MQEDYDNALTELQRHLSNGMSLNELQSSLYSGNGTVAENKEQLKSRMQHSYKRRRNVEQWLHRQKASTCVTSSALMDLVEKSMGGGDVVLRQTYRVGNCEVVVGFLLMQILFYDKSEKCCDGNSLNLCHLKLHALHRNSHPSILCCLIWSKSVLIC